MVAKELLHYSTEYLSYFEIWEFQHQNNLMRKNTICAQYSSQFFLWTYLFAVYEDELVCPAISYIPPQRKQYLYSPRLWIMSILSSMSLFFFLFIDRPFICVYKLCYILFLGWLTVIKSAPGLIDNSIFAFRINLVDEQRKKKKKIPGRGSDFFQTLSKWKIPL